MSAEAPKVGDAVTHKAEGWSGKVILVSDAKSRNIAVQWSHDGSSAWIDSSEISRKSASK